MPSPGQDQSNRLMDVVVGDHRELEAMFHQLETDTAEPRQRHELVEKAITAAVTHAVTAEQVLYPAARRALPDGGEVVDRAIALNADAERSMKDLEGRSVTDADFEPLLARMMAAVRLQAQTEERMILPRLTLAVGLDATNTTGAAFEQAKKVAPTRPPRTPAPRRPRSGRWRAWWTGCATH